jgi:hypothetical protein
VIGAGYHVVLANSDFVGGNPQKKARATGTPLCVPVPGALIELQPRQPPPPPDPERRNLGLLRRLYVALRGV